MPDRQRSVGLLVPRAAPGLRALPRPTRTRTGTRAHSVAAPHARAHLAGLDEGGPQASEQVAQLGGALLDLHAVVGLPRHAVGPQPGEEQAHLGADLHAAATERQEGGGRADGALPHQLGRVLLPDVAVANLYRSGEGSREGAGAEEAWLEGGGAAGGGKEGPRGECLHQLVHRAFQLYRRPLPRTRPGAPTSICSCS